MKKTTEGSLMPSRLALLAVAVNLAGFGLTAAQSAEAAETAKGANKAQVERGRYLVNTSGCHDCHTPFKLGANGPEPDMSRMLSGHPAGMQLPPVPALPQGPWMMVVAATNTAWSGPWGVSFTANLTPDAETGLGKWTLKDFVATIRSGRHLGRGRPVLPPMPIPAYSQFNDADLEAIYRYLQTVPAIRNRVPEPLPPLMAKSQ